MFCILVYVWGGGMCFFLLHSTFGFTVVDGSHLVKGWLDECKNVSVWVMLEILLTGAAPLMPNPSPFHFTISKDG